MFGYSGSCVTFFILINNEYISLQRAQSFNYLNNYSVLSVPSVVN